mgnify:FL=1|jgi:hypothetical protein
MNLYNIIQSGITISEYIALEEDAEALDTLSQSKDEFIRMAVAKNIYTSRSTLNQLKQDLNEQIRKEVKLNPNTDMNIDECDMQDKDDIILFINKEIFSYEAIHSMLQEKKLNRLIRIAIAKSAVYVKNSNAFILAKDNDLSVRANLAYNQNVSLEVINSMTVDIAPKVKQGIAMNPKTSESILNRIYNQDNKYLLDIVKNQNVPIKYIDKAIKSDNIEVKEVLLKHNSHLLTQVQKDSLMKMEAFSKHDELQPQIKETYVKEKTGFFRSLFDL